MKPLFVTTPIYYANANVHGGNAYGSFTADVIARIGRLMGRKVKFSTGTDENGQKMTQAAEKLGMSVMDFLDDIASQQRATWDALQISYTDFIRTTHPTHKRHVQSMLQKAYDMGDVYQSTYNGLYCVGCEGFKKESDLIAFEGVLVCPDHRTPPQQVSENNRFFKLSGYQSFIEDYYDTHPEFILPSKRYNEVQSFVEGGLEDFSISRQGSSFGIPMPFDDTAVSYIWYDALFNYHTVCMHPEHFTKNGQSVSGGINDEVFWEEGDVVHCMGKDIVRFHGIYRPAMLESVGLSKPNNEVVTGFFTIDGQKMSKSLGNTIDPVQTVSTYGRDAFVYYIFSDIHVGNDGDFSRERFVEVKDSTLKKGWGNLVARTVTLAKKVSINHVNADSIQAELFYDFLQGEESVQTIVGKIIIGEKDLGALLEYGYHGHTQILQDWYQLIKTANKRIDITKPRELIKSDPDQGRIVLEQLVWRIKGCAIISSPFLIEGYHAVKQIISIDHDEWSSSSTADGTTNRQSLIDLQEFDISLGDGKYIY